MRELILDSLNMALLVVIIGTAVVMFDHMNGKTRNSVRLGALLVFAGAIVQACGIWFDWHRWTDTLFFGGVGTMLVANVRSPIGICRPQDEEMRAAILRISDRAAYAIGCATIAITVLVW